MIWTSRQANGWNDAVETVVQMPDEALVMLLVGLVALMLVFFRSDPLAADRHTQAVGRILARMAERTQGGQAER